MKKILAFPFFILCLLALHCTQTGDNAKSLTAHLTGLAVPEIPKLLNRPDALTYGVEWDKIQNAYGTNAALLRKSPENLEARLKLAEIFIQEARVTGEHPYYYPAALQMLEPVIVTLKAKEKRTPDEQDKLFRALSHKASVQLSFHDFENARQTATEAVAINPYNAYIYGCLVDANVELGHYPEAVQLCDKMVGTRPDLRSYARVSYLREIYGDVKGSIEAMDMAVKAGYPGYEQTEWARLQLGKLYQRYGQMDAAENQFRTSLAVRDNYPFAMEGLAEVAWKKGDTKQAETLLKQAADIIPEISFYIQLAKLYQATGRTQETEKLIPQIESMIKKDMDAGHNMNLEAARFHLEVTKNLDKGWKYIQDEYNFRPDNKDVNQLMAAYELAKGDKQDAKKYLNVALRTNCKDPDLLALKQRI